MLSGKKVLVLGLAKSGKAAVELLAFYHAQITINAFDQKEDIEEYDSYIQRGFEVILGGHPQELFERDFDFVVKNPGINYKKDFVLRLKERGIPVYTEIELAYQLSQQQNYIAITGTNGKTTIVTLIYKIFKNANRNAYLAGNVGTPLSTTALEHDLIHQSGADIVLEMSNFQLLDIETFKPHICSITNLTPDHLDYMETLDEYYVSKTYIYKNQTKDDFYIRNLDDEVLNDYLTKYPFVSKEVTFSIYNEADCMIDKNAIVCFGEKIVELSGIKVVGKHNLSNIMLAIVVSMLNKIDVNIIKETIEEFYGVEHRLEYVLELDGVRYYNDSKATNTEATIIALNAFEEPVILLMGGKEKNLDLTELSKLDKRIKSLICFGEAGERFYKEMGCHSGYLVKNLEEAVVKANEIAMKDDVVLLSPSTSSYDEFKSFEDRGQMFKKYVRNLK